MLKFNMNIYHIGIQFKIHLKILILILLQVKK